MLSTNTIANNIPDILLDANCLVLRITRFDDLQSRAKEWLTMKCSREVVERTSTPEGIRGAGKFGASSSLLDASHCEPFFILALTSQWYNISLVI